MAKDVQFKGGTLDGTVVENAATESTLRELVTALNKKGGASAGNAGLDLFQRSITNSTSTVNAATKTTSVFDSALDRAGKTASSFGGIFTGLGSLISSGVSGIFNGMIATGGILVDTLKESYEGFKETSAVGATFNNNMIELQLSAAKANMSLGDYVKVVGANSTAMASLGGSVTEGAKRFSDLSRDLTQSDVGEHFRSMGMTTADMNEGMLAYIDLQSRSGNLTKMTNKDLKEGASAYLNEMDLLSKATGLSRSEMEKSAKSNAADPIIRSLQKGLNPDELAKSTASLAMVTKLGGTELLEAFKSGAAQVPDKMAQTMMLFDVGTKDFQSAFNGQNGPKGIIDIMQKITKNAEAAGMDQAALLKTYPELAGLMKAAQEAQRLAAMKPEDLAKEQAANSNITRIMGETANAFEKVFSDLKMAFFGSALFEKGGPFDEISGVLLDFLGEITKMLNDPVIQTGLKDVFSEISKWVTGLTSNLKNLDFKSIFADMRKGVTDFFKNMDFSGIIKIVTDSFSNVFGSLGTIVGKMFGGGGNTEDDKKKKELEDKKAAIQAKTANGGTLGADDQKSLASINSELDELDKKTSGGGLTKFFSGLVDTMKDLAFYTAVGGGVIILGLVALGFALDGLALPLSAILLSLGLASGGLGWMFSQLTPLVETFGNVITKTFDGVSKIMDSFSNIVKSAFDGVSNVIKSFSDAFARIPETLTELSKVSATDLLALGGALVPLSAGLTTLAAPGLVAFFLGGSLDKLSETLLKLNSMSPEGLAKTGSALKKFGDDVSTLLEGGSWFRGLTGNDGGLATMAASLKVFNDINPDPIIKLSPVLKQFGDAARSLIEGGSWWKGLTGNDGGLAGMAKGLAEFNNINPDPITKLSPVLKQFGDAARSLIEGGSWWQGLIGNDGGLAGMAKSLLVFNSVNPDIITKLTPILVDFGKGARSLIEGGSWWQGLIGNDGGLAGIAKALSVFNSVNPDPIIKLTPVLKQFSDTARSLIEGGSWWQGLIGNDGGLAGIAKALSVFNSVNPDPITKLTPVLKDFGAAARSLIEGGSWWDGLVGNDGGLAGIAKALSEFNIVNPEILIKITPVLVDFGIAARSLIEGGSWWQGLIGNDGGLSGIAKSLAEFNNINPEILASITPILVDFGKGARTLIEGGSWWQGLIGNDGGLAGIAKSLAEFNAVNGENLSTLTPILIDFGKGARTLIEGGSWWSGLTATDGGLTSLATTLSSFNKVNGSNLAALAPALVTFNTGAKTLIEGGSWWKSLTSSDGGLTTLATTLSSFNKVDGTNMNNVVSGMTGLKSAVDVNFKDSSENILTFRDSIKELNEELSNLSNKLSDIKNTGSIGGFGTGNTNAASNTPSTTIDSFSSSTTPNTIDKAEKLNNMVTELVELTKLIRDNTKDTADAAKGRTKAI